MTFEIIKSFFAIKTAIQRFAGSGPKLANDFCVKGITPGALNSFLLKHFR